MEIEIEKMWLLKTTSVPVLARVIGMIKKGTDEHIKMILIAPVYEMQQKLHFTEIFISSGNKYQRDWKKRQPKTLIHLITTIVYSRSIVKAWG